MELEQRAIFNFLHFKKMKAAEIHSELALCFGNDTYTLSFVHHWVHEFKMSRVSVEDEPRSGRPSLDDVDAAILKQLLETPFFSLRTLSVNLHIPKVAVCEHMTKSLGLQCRHFKWVPCMLTEDLLRKGIDGAKALFKVLEVQSHIGFRDAITGNES
jgi:hypothetical protein